MRRQKSATAATRRSLVLAGLLFLFATPLAAAATPVDADVLAFGRVTLEGALKVRAPAATLELVPLSQEELVVLRVASGTLRVASSSRDAIDPGPIGDIWLEPDQSSETIVLRDAEVRVRAARDDFVGIVRPSEGGSLLLDMHPSLHRLASDPAERAFLVGPGDQPPFFYNHTVPARNFAMDCPGASLVSLRADGALRVVVSGADLVVTTAAGERTWRLGERRDTTTEVGGQRTTYRHTLSFAQLAVDELDLHLGPGAAARLRTETAVFQVQGALRFDRADGSVRLGDVGGRPLHEPVALVGDFQVDARSPAAAGGDAQMERGSTGRFHVEGSTTSAQVAGVTLVSPPQVPPLAAPALLGLGALIAWATGAGPKALALLTTPGRPSDPGKLLEHDRRDRIYRMVREHPGIHLRAVHRASGIRWSALQYHTTVLLRAGLLHGATHRHRTILACDVHGLSTPQIVAMSLLREERAQRVARAMASGETLTQDVIAARCEEPRREVSRTLRLLVDLGLVEATEGKRPKLYRMTPRLTEMLPMASQERP